MPSSLIIYVKKHFIMSFDLNLRLKSVKQKTNRILKGNYKVIVLNHSYNVEPKFPIYTPSIFFAIL